MNNMEVTFACWCGEPTEIVGEYAEGKSDLNAVCHECDRVYVITITQTETPTIH